jgi:hypothetical protein
VHAAIAALLAALLLLSCYDSSVRHYTVATAPDDSCYRRCTYAANREQYVECLHLCPGVVSGAGACGPPTTGFVCASRGEPKLLVGRTVLGAGGMVVLLVGIFVVGLAVDKEFQQPCAVPAGH